MSAVTPIRGAVYAEDAYAQGKMLDNSSWSLPRSITPSDFDCIFDNGGCLVLAEFSSSCRLWAELSRGQRLAYMSAISGTSHLAALCKHSVPKTRQINTRNDVDSFQAMFAVAGDFFAIQPIAGKHWPALIDRWFCSPSDAITGLMRKNDISKIKP